MTGGALARAIRSSATVRAPTDACDLCGTATEPGHRHLLDTERDDVVCACRACGLLFVRGAEQEQRHYRLIPERRVRLPEVPTDALGVPVGLAFFVPRPDGGVLAHYPSPLGATRWEIPAERWRETVAVCPPLGSLRPEVEALLVNTARQQREHWIAPIDDCFRVVAVVRREWQGLSGGGRVWREIENFFAQLTERSD